MSKLLEGMARAAWEDVPALGPWEERPRSDRDIATLDMRAAVLWLADNITDEMVQAFRETLERFPKDKWLPSISEAKAISAALRKAAGE